LRFPNEVGIEGPEFLGEGEPILERVFAALLGVGGGSDGDGAGFEFSVGMGGGCTAGGRFVRL
jgi:hypothetical protein